MLHRKESDVPEKFLGEWVRYRAHMEEGALHWFKNLYLTTTKRKEKIINKVQIQLQVEEKVEEVPTQWLLFCKTRGEVVS